MYGSFIRQNLYTIFHTYGDELLHLFYIHICCDILRASGTNFEQNPLGIMYVRVDIMSRAFWRSDSQLYTWPITKFRYATCPIIHRRRLPIHLTPLWTKNKVIQCNMQTTCTYTKSICSHGKHVPQREVLASNF